MPLHTDIPTSADIERLAAVRGEPCVSVYLPTSSTSNDNEVARIELRNAISAAATQLEQSGVDRRQVEAITEHAEALRSDAAFWNFLSNSLAIFLTAEEAHTFRLPNTLSAALEVSDRFHIKPILRAVTFPHVAFVLALSQNAVRLVEITADSPAFEVPVAELPTNLEDAVGGTDDPNRNSFARMSSGDSDRVRLTQYARMVDRALRPLLPGVSMPLILAATDPLASIYRSVTTSTNLVDQGIEGNPDQLDNTDLATAARTILDEVYAQEINTVAQDLNENYPRERVALDTQQVARAATFGAVDTLLVDIDSHQPGLLDEADGALTRSDDPDGRDYGVADEIARRALRTGARVLAVRAHDIPGDAPVAALLRYPM